MHAVEATITTSVTVTSITPTSMAFTTNPGHPLYPGNITFAAQQVDAGYITFGIRVSADYANIGWEILFRLGDPVRKTPSGITC